MNLKEKKLRQRHGVCDMPLLFFEYVNKFIKINTILCKKDFLVLAEFMLGKSYCVWFLKILASVQLETCRTT